MPTYRVTNAEDAKGEIEALRRERSLLLRLRNLIANERDRLYQTRTRDPPIHAPGQMSLS